MSNYSQSKLHDDTNSAWYKVLSYIKPKSTVLDVGCSSGNFGYELISKKSCKVDGIELDAGDYKKAKTKLRNTWRLNIETDDLSPISEKYDYIYFGDVIEHLFYPAKTLERIKYLLNNDGKIVFSIPNMAHLSVRLMLLKGSFDYGETGLLDKTHLHFYDYSGVKRLFEEGGYEITYLDPVLNDTSAESLNEQLEAVGLKPTKEFIEFTRTTDASVYQFVGAASPVVKIPKHKKLQFTSPVNLNQKVLNNTVRHFEQTISGMNDKITSLEKNNKLMFDEITSLKRRYRHLDKVYLFVVKIRKIINKQNH